MHTMPMLCGAALLFAGCTQTVPDKKHCADLKRKLEKTERFIATVKATDTAHMEELAAAAPSYEISTSGTKKGLLRDAKKRKAKLEALYSSCRE
jgi:hypothetical protein